MVYVMYTAACKCFDKCHANLNFKLWNTIYIQKLHKIRKEKYFNESNKEGRSQPITMTQNIHLSKLALAFGSTLMSWSLGFIILMRI